MLEKNRHPGRRQCQPWPLPPPIGPPQPFRSRARVNRQIERRSMQYLILIHFNLSIMSSCPRQPTQSTINHYLAWRYSARLGSARLGSVERCSSKRAMSSAFLPCAPSPSLLSSSLISGTLFFFQTKASSFVMIHALRWCSSEFSVKRNQQQESDESDLVPGK